jgi:hypothetical protein
LVTGVLSGVLSFLPVAERLQAGRVSKHWRRELQLLSTWLDAGWHLTRHIEKANALPLPSWLCARLSVVRCSIDWLLCAAPFERFRQLKNVRHLDLLLNDLKFGTAATEKAALRRHLYSLRLLSLGLPLLSSLAPQSDERNGGSWLLSVLAQPEPNSRAPSPLARWSAKLTHLRCEIELVPDDSVLVALAAQRWPKLRKLQLTLHCDQLNRPLAAVEHLCRAFLSESMPSLTWLEVGRACYRQVDDQGVYDQDCACTDWWKHLISGVHTLTNLKLDLSCSDQIHLLELLCLISADAMPQLKQLTLVECKFLPLLDDERPAVIALLQGMPLTQLIHINPYDGGFQLLQHLPHLSVCELSGVCCEESVAAVPRLQTLSCSAYDIEGIAERWWRRCGCPPRQHAGFVDEEKWQDHLTQRAHHHPAAAVAGTSAPVIRVLRCGSPRLRGFPMRARIFPYLAHLPQLRELECCLNPMDLRALALLPQLEQLTLWLTEFVRSSMLVYPWSNDAVRTLGELPLHRLHSLRLEGDDEQPKLTMQVMQLDDPDFPCQHRTDRQGQTRHREPRDGDATDAICFYVLCCCVRRGKRTCGRSVYLGEACLLRPAHAARTAPPAQSACAHLSSSAVD